LIQNESNKTVPFGPQRFSQRGFHPLQKEGAGSALAIAESFPLDIHLFNFWGRASSPFHGESASLQTSKKGGSLNEALLRPGGKPPLDAGERALRGASPYYHGSPDHHAPGRRRDPAGKWRRSAWGSEHAILPLVSRQRLCSQRPHGRLVTAVSDYLG